MSVRLIQVAALGPVLAAALWLGLVRWPWARRLAGGAVGLAAHAAAWGVFWDTYRGTGAAWRSLDPTLLGATAAAAAQVAIVVGVLRAERLPWPGAPSAVAGLAVSASALVYLSYTNNLVVVGLFLVLPTLAAVGAGLSGTGRGDVSGFIGLAAADAAALFGLSMLFARSHSAALAADPGASVALLLLLGAAAVKAGAVPGVGTWWMAATEAPGAPVALALRGQGMALAALAALVVGASRSHDAVVVGAGAAVLLAGAGTVLARRSGQAVTGLTGAAAGVPFLALGLGGAVGTRAFLVAFPAFLLAAAAAALLEPDDRPPASAVLWTVLGVVGLTVAAASLAGLPLGGGFPGTWLTLSLGTVRGLEDPWVLAVAAAAGVGLVLALLAAIPALRLPRPGPVAAVAGVALALGLLYAGAQPVRLGIGWWLRVEGELGVPLVLPTAGAPDLPAIGGGRLAAALAPVLLLTAVVVGLGRGLRAAGGAFVPLLGARPRRGRRAPPRTRAGVLLVRAREEGLGFGVALVFEVGALVLAARLLLLGAQRGFL